MKVKIWRLEFLSLNKLRYLYLAEIKTKKILFIINFESSEKNTVDTQQSTYDHLLRKEGFPVLKIVLKI